MFWFNDCHTIESLKAKYRKLAMQHHPDMGGDLATMQEINGQYDHAYQRLSAAEAEKPYEERAGYNAQETPEAWRAAIMAIIGLDGLQIDLVGCWVWVSGETKRHKDALKAAGYRWSNKRKMWYWRAGDRKRRYRQSSATYAELCDKYGRESFKSSAAIVVA